MSTGTLVAGPLPKIGRPELAQIPVPEATFTLSITLFFLACADA